MSEEEKELERVRTTTYSLFEHTYAAGLAHLAIADRWAKYHRGIGLGSTILSVIAGSSLLSGSDKLELIAGILSVIISALIATTTVLNPGKISQEHFVSSTSYLVLKNKLQFFYDVESMKTGKNNVQRIIDLQELSEERNELDKKSPRIPKKEFDKGWKEGLIQIERTWLKPEPIETSARAARRQGPPTYGKRYVGNTDKKEVHDLDNEKTGPNECKIDEIITADHARIFSSDTLEQAHKEGYDNCAHCIGRSTS